MIMNKEHLRNSFASTALMCALTVSAGIAMSANAPAEAAGICPSAAEITTSQTLSAACKQFLIRKLDSTVYLEGRKDLEVATYQKETGLPVDGAIGPITAKHILAGDKLRVASPRHNRTEFLVDKQRQVAYDIVNGTVKHEISVSTGTEKPFADRSKFDGHMITGVAHTPTGSWHVFRSEGPDYKAPLGGMPNARFFYEGFAVHEDPTTVRGRGSHGCVRVDHLAMPEIMADLHNGSTVEVVEHL